MKIGKCNLWMAFAKFPYKRLKPSIIIYLSHSIVVRRTKVRKSAVFWTVRKLQHVNGAVHVEHFTGVCRYCVLSSFWQPIRSRCLTAQILKLSQLIFDRILCDHSENASWLFGCLHEHKARLTNTILFTSVQCVLPVLGASARKLWPVVFECAPLRLYWTGTTSETHLVHQTTQKRNLWLR